MEKTCGNCGHGERRAISCPKRDGLYVPSKLACGEWKERTDTLEQRYQQLQQVAVRMWDTINDFLASSYARQYREQLEALGVSLDD